MRTPELMGRRVKICEWEFLAGITRPAAIAF